tara:strand:- start:1021 stop:1368 length:348 start_codon:yes stop_codon:yes gene_type:complete
MLGLLSTLAYLIDSIKRMNKSNKNTLIPIPRQIDDLYQDNIKGIIERNNALSKTNNELSNKYKKLSKLVDEVSEYIKPHRTWSESNAMEDYTQLVLVNNKIKDIIQNKERIEVKK